MTANDKIKEICNTYGFSYVTDSVGTRYMDGSFDVQVYGSKPDADGNHHTQFVGSFRCMNDEVIEV